MSYVLQTLLGLCLSLIKLSLKAFQVLLQSFVNAFVANHLLKLFTKDIAAPDDNVDFTLFLQL